MEINSYSFIWILQKDSLVCIKIFITVREQNQITHL